MTNKLANFARVTTGTVGVGTLSLGSVVQGCNTFADAGVLDGETVTYGIEDYNAAGVCIAREGGAGVYNHAAQTLTRASVYSSTNGGAKINLSGNAHVFVGAAKEDFDSLLSITLAAATYLTIAAAVAGYQPLDADLTSLAGAASTNVLYYRSAADTWSPVTVHASIGFSGGTLGGARTITGTANQVIVTNGDGVAGNPTLSTPQDIATGSSPQFAGINVGHATDTTLTRVSAGLVAVEGNTVAMLNTANMFLQNQIIQKASPNFRQSATSGDAAHLIDAISGNAAVSRYGFWNGSAHVDRWLFGKAATAESGGDAGSDFIVYYYTDAGAFKGQLLAVSRVDGSLNFSAGGVYSNGVTGGSKGAGTLNFGTLYEGGTALTAKYGQLAAGNIWTVAQVFRIDDAVNTGITRAAKASHTTTGTAGVGIGTGYEFEVENGSGTNKVVAAIDAVTTNVTAGAEAADVVFKAMAGGAAAAEVGRLKSTGTFKQPTFTVAGLPAGSVGEVSFATNGRKNGEGAGAGTGVLVFHDGTAWRACDTGATVAA